MNEDKCPRCGTPYHSQFTDCLKCHAADSTAPIAAPAPRASDTPETKLPTDLFDVVQMLHIITGPNGQCMCGTNGKTCLEILSKLSTDIEFESNCAALGYTRMELPEPTYKLPPPKGLLR